MIVEIGTSDFRTRAGIEEGVFVEPVKYYFDRLPDCDKEQVAIMDYEGYGFMFYLTEEDIQHYGLPNWVRGCNNLHQPHPTVAKLLDERGIALVFRTWFVITKRIKWLIDKYELTHIDTLKIDTEGYDARIINDYLDTVSFLPTVIQFECNALSDINEISLLLRRLETIGYRCRKQPDLNIICTLKD